MGFLDSQDITQCIYPYQKMSTRNLPTDNYINEYKDTVLYNRLTGGILFAQCIVSRGLLPTLGIITRTLCMIPWSETY